MLSLKSNVGLAALMPQTVLAVLVAQGIFKEVGNYDLVITSANDSQHGGHPIPGTGETKDPHYTGRAFDLRVHNVQPADVGRIVLLLRTALGMNYGVLWESQGTQNEHVHVQYAGSR